jgi:cell division protein FtsI (penicillin-binding protein 3)
MTPPHDRVRDARDKLADTFLDGRPVGDDVLRAGAWGRVRVGMGLLLAGAISVTLKAGWLMLFPDSRLEEKAQAQLAEPREERGRRGDLLDSQGNVLATSVRLGELHADPMRLGEERVRRVAPQLARILGKDAAEIEARLLRDLNRQDVLLGRELQPEQEVQIRALRRELRKEDKELEAALFMRYVQRRFYAGQGDGAALLGLVDARGRGSEGLEALLDKELRGRLYRTLTLRDRKGRSISTDVVEPPPGRSARLTLDRRIQHAADEALLEAIRTVGAQAAHAVVVDVRTGGLLAVANQPTANPNAIHADELRLLRNHAMQDAIEPGSVFKPFIAAAALADGLYEADSMIDCELGAWRVGTNTIHDDHPKGAITVSEVIKYSSNIGAAKLALELGAEKTLRYLRDFGFGRPTGLGLSGESRGLLRAAHSIKPIELATTSYGHGATANAAQLAYAMAALGNNGVRMEPRIVEAWMEGGAVVHENPPEIDREVVDAATARAVVQMMETVTDEGGTGTRARISGYRVAGKTGTAWKHIPGGGYSETDRIGSFVGLVPADNPRLAIAVVVDTPTIGSKYGGIVAAPAFAHIAAASMQFLGVPPDPALVIEKKAPAKAPAAKESADALALAEAEPALLWMGSGAFVMPALEGRTLRDAFATLQGAGLEIVTRGSGRVAETSPPAGAPLPPGARVELVLK